MSESVRDTAWGEVQHSQRTSDHKVVEVRKTNDLFNVFLVDGSEFHCVEWQAQRETAGKQFKALTAPKMDDVVKEAFHLNKQMWQGEER